MPPILKYLKAIHPLKSSIEYPGMMWGAGANIEKIQRGQSNGRASCKKSEFQLRIAITKADREVK